MMKAFFGFLVIWLRGKKTYLVGVSVLVVLVVLVFLGRLTPAVAVTVLAFAAPAFAMTFRSTMSDRANQEISMAIQHKAEVMAVLKDIATVGVYMKMHDGGDASKAAAAACRDGSALASVIQMGESAK